jgi:hypothetical protein
MERALPGRAREVLETGLDGLGDSPAKFKKLSECLDLLKDHLAKRDFDVGPILRLLYGEKLDPGSDRAQTICIRCRKLMSAQGQDALSADEFEELLELVGQEQQDALNAYGLQLDQKTMTRSARLARLGSGRDDRWMNQQGERLRQAIDRKQWVITGLLQTLGLAQQDRSTSDDETRREHRRPPTPLPPGQGQNKPNKSSRINKSAQKQTENKPKQTQVWKAPVPGKPFGISKTFKASEPNLKTDPTGGQWNPISQQSG